MSISITPDISVFNKERHIKYWLRCLKTYLPTGYTSNDSNRMMIACFTLSALDLLGVLHERTVSTERAEYVDWIYRCQHPNGGFRGFTGTDVGDLRNEKNECWDPANLAGTYFALAALLVLGDGLERVRRTECLEWVKSLQSRDGSFGETMLDTEGVWVPTRDVRFCFLAALVRWMLRGKEEEEQNIPDIDVGGLVGFIKSSHTYDGGIARAPFHEAHAGCTYCGIGTLTLLGALPPKSAKSTATPALNSTAAVGPDFVETTVQWLVSRQTSLLQDYEEFQLSEEDPSHPAEDHDSQNLHAQSAHPLPAEIPHNVPMPPPSQDELQWAGFNGRCNKVADTCYSFWVGGTLGILNKVHLFDFNANRRYLLDKTQHLVGGFGKLPGDPPDILHSYLGLAALATMREAELKSIDPTLCISVSAREVLEGLAWRK